jgi:hypothetical protein
MSALIALSRQISDSKLASNQPHLMDLCAQFVKTLTKFISKDTSDWPKDRLFIDDLEDVLNGTVKYHAINKCSTIKLYYITSPPQEVHANQVMSALITLSKQISDSKPASNQPHPMDLCAQFVKTLNKSINATSVTHTPDMGLFPCDLIQYQSTSAIETMIKKAGYDRVTESLLMKYFNELDSPAVEAFLKHPMHPNCKAAFLNHFTYLSHDDSTKMLHPPFVNSYRSLVFDPWASPL